MPIPLSSENAAIPYSNASMPLVNWSRQAGNWKHERAIPYLIQLLYDGSPLVRGHAAWALWQTMELDSSQLLTDLYRRDDDERVRREVAALLE